MKNIILLGASGSIGKQTIDIIREHKDRLNLVGVSVGTNVDFLSELLNEFKPKYAYCIKENSDLVSNYQDTKFFFGDKGLEQLAKVEDYDLLVNALVGFVGFKPTLAAIENKKDIALANKETLVSGGDIITNAVKEYGVKMIPIDSEHSAIMECMEGHRKEDIKSLIITASGGAFRDKKREELADVKLEDALNHPTWTMGPKITVDCATLMNKAYEIMEAHYLFDIPYEKITPVIHPESIVHSMVEYNDGSIIAQLAQTDMRMPIRKALLYPDNAADSYVKHLDFSNLLNLNFKPVDNNRYPFVKLVTSLAGFGGNFGAILTGANDEAVDLFMNNRISFLDIETYVIRALKEAHYIQNPSAEELVMYNNWARDFVRNTWANNI